MPPLRRAGLGRGAGRPAPYHHNGWLSRRGKRVDVDSGRNNGTSLSDDALAAILTRLPDAADVVRCAATCRRWGRVVADVSCVLRPALPTLQHLALGFFHQDSRKRMRSTGSSSAQPCFVPTASGTRLLNIHGGGASVVPFADDVSGLLDYSRPVASRNGRVVLELRHEGHAAGLRLCVCNPMTGVIDVLPPLDGDDKPGTYACALLTVDDLDPAPSSGSFFFFRVLIVYNQRSFTALRSYSSDTASWSTEVRRPGSKMRHATLQQLGQSVVHGGVAYWPVGYTALAVRMDTAEPREVAPMPAGLGSAPQHRHLLGLTPDGKLSFISTRVTSDDGSLVVVTEFILTDTDTASGDGKYRARKQEMTRCIVLTQVKVQRLDAVSLRWFCEKSGVLLFTLGAGSTTPGAYALDLATEELQKLADGTSCGSWSNVVGYEMDGPVYLASLAR